MPFRRSLAAGELKSRDELEPEAKEANGNGRCRFERLCYRALAEDFVSLSKAAELLRITLPRVEAGLKGPQESACGLSSVTQAASLISQALLLLSDPYSRTIVRSELLDNEKKALLGGGLEVATLSVSRAEILPGSQFIHSRLPWRKSIAGAFCLPGIPLRSLAETCQIEVHGVLWIFDQI